MIGAPIEVLSAHRMRRVEELMRRALTTDLREMADVVAYVFEAGGKRLRPGLTLLCGRLFDAEWDTITPIAAAVEMIHTATLLHDDIMDASPTRRGRRTVACRWDPLTAAAAGDFILAHAFRLLAACGRDDVLRAVSRITTRLCEGEVLQAQHRHNASVTVEQYLEIIDCKTADFLSCCCRLGAMLAGAPADAGDAIADFGLHLGRVFQITDDLLDYLGEPEVTGKDVGADFREGKYTLPVIMALREPSDASTRLRGLIACGDLSSDTFIEVRRAVVEAGGVRTACDAARSSFEAAVAALDALPSGAERDALRKLASWITSRST